MKLTNTLLTASLVAGKAFGDLNTNGDDKSIVAVASNNAVEKVPYVPDIEKRDKAVAVVRAHGDGTYTHGAAAATGSSSHYNHGTATAAESNSHYYHGTASATGSNHGNAATTGSNGHYNHGTATATADTSNGTGTHSHGSSNSDSSGSSSGSDSDSSSSSGHSHGSSDSDSGNDSSSSSSGYSHGGHGSGHGHGGGGGGHAAARNKGINMGWGPWAFLLLCVILRAIFYWTMRLAPAALNKTDNRFLRQLRKHVFLAPTVNYHHATQIAPRWLGRFTFNIPTRDQTLMLIGVFIASFVPCFVGYTVNADATAEEKMRNLCKAIGMRTGIIATMLLPPFFLFGGRNNFLLWITGWPIETFNVLHKWIGRWCIVILSVHGLMYTIMGISNGSVSDNYTGFKGALYIWGTVGYIAGLIIFFQGMHWFRQLNYEVFLCTHIVMAIVFVIGTYYHLLTMGCHEFVWATISVWGFDRVMRVARLLWSGVKSKAQCTQTNDPNIIEMKIDYSQRWKFYPGCFVFIHFKRWNRFWQSHPFSVIESPKPTDDGKLVILFRAKRGVTKTMKRYLEQNGGTAESGVLIEGPYGPRYPVHKYDTLLCFAGGIGVTGTYSHAGDILKHPELKTRVVFVWTVSDEKPLVWFKEYLDAMRNDPRFEVIVHVTRPTSTPSLTEFSTSSDSGEDVEHVLEKSSKNASINEKDFFPGRPDSDKIIREFASDSANGNIGVAVCGPGPLIDNVRECVRNNMVNASGRIDYFEEFTSW